MNDLPPFTQTVDGTDLPETPETPAVRLPDDIGPVLAWAKSLPPLSIAGIPINGERCPLAHYLKDQGSPCPEVGTDDYRTDEGSFFTTPDWAQDVIGQVDDRGGHGIQARTFVRILEAVAALGVAVEQ